MSQAILEKPVISEKAKTLQDRTNCVAFRVAATANKHQIRAAVEAVYGVKVTGVRTMMVPGKRKRRGTVMSKRANWKKALVTLDEGQKIDFFATE